MRGLQFKIAGFFRQFPGGDGAIICKPGLTTACAWQQLSRGRTTTDMFWAESRALTPCRINQNVRLWIT